MAYRALLLLSLAATLLPATADITVINDVVVPDELYDTIILKDSDHRKELSDTQNHTKYYCIVRNLWTKESTPFKYPALARWSQNILYSSTLQYQPWVMNRQTTQGVEKIAETGFIDDYRTAADDQKELVKDIGESKGYFLDQDDNEENFVFVDGISVDSEFPFISGMAGISPSPDWYTGFYLLDTIDKFDFTYWERIQIHTYPWDAGTDAGDAYNSLDRDLNPPINVERIRKGSTRVRDGVFLNPEGTSVPPVAEWDCVLHVCPDMENCDKPNWPPANQCDLIKYPGCETPCDPNNPDPDDPEWVCQQCKPRNILEEQSGEPIYYTNCCESRYEPLDGSGCGKPGDSSGAIDTRSLQVAVLTALSLIALVAF